MISILTKIIVHFTLQHNLCFQFCQHWELVVNILNDKSQLGVSHHDGDLPLVDVEVGHIVDIHPLESTADATVRPSQKHHRETS